MTTRKRPMFSVIAYVALYVGMFAAVIADHAATAVVLSALFVSNVIIDATERLIATRPKVMELRRKSVGGAK